MTADKSIHQPANRFHLHSVTYLLCGCQGLEQNLEFTHFLTGPDQRRQKERQPPAVFR